MFLAEHLKKKNVFSRTLKEKDYLFIKIFWETKYLLKGEKYDEAWKNKTLIETVNRIYRVNCL